MVDNVLTVGELKKWLGGVAAQEQIGSDIAVSPAYATVDHVHVADDNKGKLLDSTGVIPAGGEKGQTLRYNPATLSWDWGDNNMYNSNTLNYTNTTGSSAAGVVPYTAQYDYKIKMPEPGVVGESKQGGVNMNNSRIVDYRGRTFEVAEVRMLGTSTKEYTVGIRGTNYVMNMRYDRVRAEFVLWEHEKGSLGLQMNEAIRQICDLLLTEEANDNAVKDFFGAENVLCLYEDDGWVDMGEMEEECTDDNMGCGEKDEPTNLLSQATTEALKGLQELDKLLNTRNKEL